MAAWKTEILAMLSGLLGNPSSTVETVILAVVAVMSCLIGLRITSGIFGLKQNAWWRIVFVFVVTAVTALAAAAAVGIYLLDAESSTALRIGLQAGVAVVILLAVGIPLQFLLQKGTYLESLSCFAATLIVTALLTAGVHTAYQAIVAGGSQMQHAADRNKQTRAETDEAGK